MTDTSWPPTKPEPRRFVVSFDIEVTATTPEEAVAISFLLGKTSLRHNVKNVVGVVDLSNHTASLIDLNTVEEL